LKLNYKHYPINDFNQIYKKKDTIIESSKTSQKEMDKEKSGKSRLNDENTNISRSFGNHGFQPISKQQESSSNNSTDQIKEHQEEDFDETQEHPERLISS
jgi:hypothetical protein